MFEDFNKMKTATANKIVELNRVKTANASEISKLKKHKADLEKEIEELEIQVRNSVWQESFSRYTIKNWLFLLG